MGLRATVITDASYCPKTRSAGYGAWITMDSGTSVPLRIRKGGRLKGYPNNPAHAELLAALTGLWYAYKQGARILLLQTDNMEVVAVIKGRAGAPSNLLTMQYREALAEVFVGASISARHVKGHTTIQDARSYVNRWCDAQAGIHMRSLRSERDHFNDPHRATPKNKKRGPDSKRFMGAIHKTGNY